MRRETRPATCLKWLGKQDKQEVRHVVQVLVTEASWPYWLARNIVEYRVRNRLEVYDVNYARHSHV